MKNGSTRRTFIKAFGAALTLPVMSVCSLEPKERPNILWLVSEDNCPFLGCYGDTFADTPNIDQFARQGILYENAFSNAPVCAPARSTIITGCYSSSLGTFHMRSQYPIPEQIKMFPQYLRAAGYYCTNNAKEDYNTIKPDGVWDESSREATYEKRGPGQPFFSVFNFQVTHESCLHKTEPTIHDPAQVTLPPYHPDTPEIRHDWAQYYDKMSELDKQIAAALQKLKDAGLEENTIVFYYGDNGGVLPRSKRYLYDTGTHIPMIVRVPEKYKHLVNEKPGTKTDRLVSFVDLAPTILSLAGINIPENIQGEAFLGPQAKPPREYVYLFRGRMDERYDLMRAVRDKQFKYIRNYMPHRVYAQYLNYLWLMPATRSWEKMFKEGKVNDVQKIFWGKKPMEELYDITKDPWEVNNLAGNPEYAETLERMRAANVAWLKETHDPGFLPEAEMAARAESGTIYDMARDPQKYDQSRLMQAATAANRMDAALLPVLVEMLNDADSGVRYWAAEGCLALGTAASAAQNILEEKLTDPCPDVSISAAEALLAIGQNDKALDLLADVLKNEKQDYARLHAAIALDYQDNKARKYLRLFKDAFANDEPGYVQWVMKKAIMDLEG